MTVRRNDNEKLEVLSWGPGTKAYRLVLLGAVMAATPIGQNILNAVGIKTPVLEEVAAVKLDVGALKEDVKHLKEDVGAVKAKSDKLDLAFTGFQIDFQKFQNDKKVLP